MKQLNSIELLTLVGQLRRHGGDYGDTEAKRARDSLPSSLWESKGAFAGSRLRVGDGDRKLSEYEVALLLGEREQPLHIDNRLRALPQTISIPKRYLNL